MTKEEVIKMLKYNSNVVHKNMNGKTFNRWCGRCGSDNERKDQKTLLGYSAKITSMDEFLMPQESEVDNK